MGDGIMRNLIFVAAVLSAAVLSADAFGQEAASSSDLTKRVIALEGQVKALADRKPRLDCETKLLRVPASNNFQPSIPTPAGYQLVGGSCGFDTWQTNDKPDMINVGPITLNSDGKTATWNCYAKIPRATSFTVTATFCRVVQ